MKLPEDCVFTIGNRLMYDDGLRNPAGLMKMGAREKGGDWPDGYIGGIAFPTAEAAECHRRTLEIAERFAIYAVDAAFGRHIYQFQPLGSFHLKVDRPIICKVDPGGKPQCIDVIEPPATWVDFCEDPGDCFSPCSRCLGMLDQAKKGGYAL